MRRIAWMETNCLPHFVVGSESKALYGVLENDKHWYEGRDHLFMKENARNLPVRIVVKKARGSGAGNGFGAQLRLG
jgi:hypothetical protein